MLRRPSSRKRGRSTQRVNLIPILDAVFIFIFFLLSSANLAQIFEISSDVPIISDGPLPEDKKVPLALTILVKADRLVIKTGVPGKTHSEIKNKGPKQYDLVQLHQTLVKLKLKHQNEESVILEPIVDISYESIVQLMDAMRTLAPTDPAIYQKDKYGNEIRLKTLFSKIVFGNIMS